MLSRLIQFILGFLRGSPQEVKQTQAVPVPAGAEVKPAATKPAAKPALDKAPGEPKWLALARAQIGVKELAGEADNPAIMGYFKDAGFPGIDSESTSWCAGFANAMLERCGVSGSKSLAARSFLNWGKEVKKPYPGCIVVFWRGSPSSWQGHVGFYIGEDKSHVMVLGGNQGDSVKIASYPKNQLLGYREPVSAATSRTLKAANAGALLAGMGGAVILDSQTQLMGISAIFKELGGSIPAFMVGAAILQIVVYLVIVWARYDDMKTKGR